MKIGFYNFLYFLDFTSCSACFNPRDNRVAIITFSQNPFLFRENKIKIEKKEHSDLFNLNTKIPIYFKNQKIVFCPNNQSCSAGLESNISVWTFISNGDEWFIKD